MTGSPQSSCAKRIAIIKLGALGDVILATSLIRAIQAHHNGAQIHLLTTPAFAALFEAWPQLRVTAIERRGARGFFRMLAFLRSGFDRVYDLQSNDRTRLLCAMSGIAERVGNHPKFPWNIHPPDPWLGKAHIFSRMNQVLAAAGIPPAEERSWLPVNDAQREKVSTWLSDHDLAAGSFVLFHAGASEGRAEKRWPGFVTLCQLLIEEGVRVVAIGATPDASTNRKLQLAGAIDATNEFSIPELSALAHSARCAISNDSGPMHIMAIAPIPVYAFFGPSDWRRNHALGQAERVLNNPDLAAISAQDVVARLHHDGVLVPQSAS